MLYLKVIHIIGILMVLMSLGGVVMHVMNGGTKKSNSQRYLVALTHGFGMAAIVISGIGMLHAGQISPWPGWVHTKFLIWLWFGLIMALVNRKPQSAKLVWWALIVVGGIAATLALYKPF